MSHFKPGSVDGIRQVVYIAAANPDFAIIMQWAGGRAGGHHSFEDFHQPILATYSRVFAVMTTLPLLRVLALVVRMARSHILPVTGRSLSAWSRCPLMGSSLGLASWLLRGRTSHSVKDLTVAAAGVDDSQWEGTYVHGIPRWRCWSRWNSLS
jgi:fatty acid synthase subunit alpha, fungi type